jgi:hypothetical protein
MEYALLLPAGGGAVGRLSDDIDYPLELRLHSLARSLQFRRLLRGLAAGDGDAGSNDGNRREGICRDPPKAK